MNNQPTVSSPLLELRQVSLVYGKTRVVDSIDLSIGENELVCLLGPSGCGKTSTLRIASGVERQTSGAVFFQGREISGPKHHAPPEARQIGLMFQDFALFPHMSVLANVGFGLKALDRAARRERSMAALERMGMAHLAEAYPHMLSGGEQQRVALCRALAPDPKIMLMDEPFSGLDRGLRNAVRDETRQMLASAGASGLLVTHDAEEAMGIADRIVLMRKGKFVQIGSPREIYDHPVDLESAELFSEINKLEGIIEGGSLMSEIGSFDVNGAQPRAKADIALRYSDFRLQEPSDKPSYQFKVTIRSVRFLGRDCQIEFQGPNGGQILRARLPDNASLAAGEHTELYFPKDKVLIFERK